MRLATTALLLATTALTACSGKTTGTGTGSPPGAPQAGIDVPGDGTTKGGTTTAAPSAYDPLFVDSASATVTPHQMAGLWAGTGNQGDNVDVRLLITPSDITIAVRCHDTGGAPVTIGLDVSAMVSAQGIRLLESQSVGTSPCRIVTHVVSMESCFGGGGGGSCFDLNGTSLEFYAGNLFTGLGPLSEGPAARFEKLNDGM